MHASREYKLNKRAGLALRLAGILAIGMLALAACAAPSGTAGTATGAVPQTGATGTTAPTTAVTMAATSAATSVETMAATSAATSATTGTPAATGAATMAATSAAGGAGTGTPAAMTSAPATVALAVKTSSAGQYLADDKGMTLYIYKKDTPGASTCTDQCAVNWPPLLVATGGQVTLTGGGDTTKLGTITRADGGTQVTYKDQPLYYFVKDKAPGDTTGQGVGSVWFLAQP